MPDINCDAIFVIGSARMFRLLMDLVNDYNLHYVNINMVNQCRGINTARSYIILKDAYKLQDYHQIL